MWKHLILACTILGMLALVNPAQGYEVTNVRDGGAITGHVSFVGQVPEPLSFEVKKNVEVCGKERILEKVLTRNGKLQGAVIMLEGVNEGKPFPSQSFKGREPGQGAFDYQGGEGLGLQVKTKGCNFGPFAGVVAADQEVKFSNQDSMKHVLHTFVSLNEQGSALRTVHNRDIRSNDEIERTFTTDKLRGHRIVRMTCNRHDFMQNWLYVVDNPYYAISDEAGRFVIDQIPPGRYVLKAWHPVLGMQEQAVEIAALESKKKAFRFVREDK